MAIALVYIEKNYGYAAHRTHKGSAPSSVRRQGRDSREGKLLTSLGLRAMQSTAVSGVENPCVGGSIPPQATSIHAPQRPFRVWGVSTNPARFLQKKHLWRDLALN